MNHQDEKDAWLDQIVTDNQKLMYQIAYTRLKKKEDVDDVVQQAAIMFTKQYYKYEYYKDKTDDEMRRLLAQITRRRVSVFLRDEGRRMGWIDQSSMESADIPWDDSLEEIVFGKIGAEMIRDTIRELPEEYATYLYLSAELGLSPENIADVLQVKPSSLRMIAYRARKMLRAACESKGLEVGNRGKRK